MESFATLRGGGAESFGVGGQTRIGVVLAEEDAVFGARGEHAIGLVYAFCYQVIDENADIGFVAAQGEGRISRATQGGIDTGHHTLAGRFLVARGTIYLTGEEKAFDLFRFERVVQLCRRKEVVFDGVARAINAQIAETRNLFQSFDLHMHRQ